MTPNDDLTAKAHALVLRARAALSSGDLRTYHHAREDLAGIVQKAFVACTSRYAGRWGFDPDDVDGGCDCAQYVDGLIEGESELPRSIHAYVGTMAHRRAVDEVRCREKHASRDAARFMESGHCTPLGSAGEEVSAGAISMATTTASHEDQVIMRLDYRAAIAAMSYDDRVATVGFEAVGLSAEECCSMIDCSPNALYVRRHRGKIAPDSVAGRV